VPGTRSVVRDDLYVEHRPQQAREDHSERNLRLIRRAYEAGDHDPRTIFYLANELRDNGLFNEAVQRYSEFVSAPGSRWEVYWALVYKARCLRALGRQNEAVDSFLAAIGTDPMRAEAFTGLGRIHYDNQAWSAAIPFFAAAASLSPPTVGFVERSD